MWLIDTTVIRSRPHDASLRASLFFRRLAPVEAVVVNGVRDTVLHDNPGSVTAPQAYAASNTTQL
jgi:hypothetical protein